MAKDGRRKNRRPSVPVAASDSGKNSTSNPNIESLDWVTCKQEEQLDKFIRKKLAHVYGQALSTLVYMGYDEDVALQGLLERGYCVGKADCLSNVVQNCLEFLTGKDDAESEEQDRPQPFKNLELSVDFNLHFWEYILQKYSPNLNRMCILRCILMTDLNLNRAITMNMPFNMPSDLNPDDDNGDDGEKDVFLALEIREMLDNLNVLDDSVSEDMKDAMIAGLQKPMDDLMVQVKERIRWASKKVVEARRKQPSTIMSLLEELRLFECSLESMLARRNSELLSTHNGVDNAEKTVDRLDMVKVEIKAEISASKLIESETEQKCLQVSKKKNRERQKVKLQEELELEKKKISKWEQQLVEIEAAITLAVMKLCEAINAKKTFNKLIYLENQVALEKWNCWKRKVDALKIQTNGEIDIFNEQMKRLGKLLKDAISFVVYK
ncbi:MND1-interacting protein 1-like [Impatiens glandulifera]|uniref:MND1-interacting protein 1-like n=1 Tax=Impatiens glandulifera TaxID=253017 RepID=UPI001FB11FC2|nr:MND1-interacting protein 1-like [Impatiens glandulifera]